MSDINIVMATIVAARKKKRITQKEMANKLGVHIKTYRKKESGDIKLSEIFFVCRIIGIKVLFVGEDNVVG